MEPMYPTETHMFYIHYKQYKKCWYSNNEANWEKFEPANESAM